MGYALILLLLTCGIGNLSTIITRNYARKTARIPNSYNIYLLLVSPAASLFFFFSAKGNVALNLPTFLFSLVFAVVSLLSMWLGLVSYQKASLVHASVFVGAGGVVLPFFFEMIFFGEDFSGYRLLSVLVRLITIMIPLIADRNSFRGVGICVIRFFISGLAGIIPKLYIEHPQVMDINVFCFWTNIFIFPIVCAMVLSRSKPQKLIQNVRQIHPLFYVSLLVAIFLGNIGTLMSMQVLEYISATLSSVISSSLSMISITVLSVFLYREPLSKATAISVALSIFAVILSVM